MKYTTSFRNSVLKKILPPSNRSVTSVSKETGVAVVTINNWLARLKEGKMSLDEDDENPSSMRNSCEKLDLLIEYQTVSEENQGGMSSASRTAFRASAFVQTGVK